MQIPTPVDSKLAEIDARLSRVEGITEQMNTRLTSLEQGQRDLSTRVDSMTTRVDSMTTRIDGLSNRMLTFFCWLVGIQVTTLLTLGTLILFKLE